MTIKWGEVALPPVAAAALCVRPPLSALLSLLVLVLPYHHRATRASMTAAPSRNRNPFLSPETSSVHFPPSSPGPSIHSAFADLDLGREQPALTPQHTAASTTSNNPFLDRPLLPSAATRPQQTLSASGSGRPLNAQELAELEGTAVNVVVRETAPTPAAATSASSQPVERPPSPEPPAASSSTSTASSSYVPPVYTRRVAEGNEDFRGASSLLWPALGIARALTRSGHPVTFVDDDEALEAAIQASLAESGISAQPTTGPSTSSASVRPPTLPARSKAETYAPPAGPPPIPAVRPPSPSQSLPQADPPPAYTSASQMAESTIDAGPRVPDFARRPTTQPLEPQHTGWSDGGGNPGGFFEPGDYRPPGVSPAPPLPSPLQNPYPPQQQPSHHYTPAPPLPHRPQQQPSYGSSSSGQIPFDPTPSSIPIIGRPFLNNGATLVYPAGFQCYKCSNSGCVSALGEGFQPQPLLMPIPVSHSWKENDPTHPCRTCWKKYGRPYSSAHALAWNPPPPTFQRPLGAQHRPMYASGPSSWASPPGIYRPVVRAPPVGSVVYQPGDPRIGGRLCHACGGSGLKIGLFFDDETCRVCGGVGRLF